MKLICWIFSVLIFPCLNAQQSIETNVRPLITDSTQMVIHFLEEQCKNKVSVCMTCEYHWLKGGKVMKTNGGYDGKLLDGMYTESYHNGDLREKGLFEKGLKSGEWRSWYRDGKLNVISHWKKGQLDGTMLIYSESGGLKEELNYKSGLQHGRQYYHNDSSTVVVRFKNGLKLDDKPKKEKKPKEVPAKQQKIDQEENVQPPVDKKKKKEDGKKM